MAIERNLANLSSSEGFTITGEGGGQAGYSVSDAGDVNGDGYADVVVGAIGAGANRQGAAYVVFGKAGGLSDVDLGSLGTPAGFKIVGSASDDLAGSGVSSAGDVNGDGFDDLIVGTKGLQYNGYSYSYDGAAYVIFGKKSGFGTINLAALDPEDGIKIAREADDDHVGRSVSSAGDINGDGFDDILIGGDQNDGGGLDSGAAYVIFGKADGWANVDLASLGAGGFKIQGDRAGDRAGISVSSAGDFNNDGFDDILIGAAGNDAGGEYAGATYLVFGKAGGFTDIDLTTMKSAQGFRVAGDLAHDRAGGAVSAAGDVNGDGFADLIIGAIGDDTAGDYAGAAYVIFGKASSAGRLDLGALDPANGFKIVGAVHNDYTGTSVSSAGDVNGDGFDDILIGAPRDDTTGSNAGAAYVVYGKAGGFGTVDLQSLADADGFKLLGATDHDLAGRSVSGAGDVNGDGFADLLVGAPYGANYAGISYVVYGQAPGESVTRVGSAIGQTIRGGAFDDKLSGRGGDDALFGADGNDVLDGGSGADTMDGGIGNDTYVVDNAGDVISEEPGEGSDTIKSSISYVLGGALEKLILIGSSAINGTGNNLDNVITGNVAANLLNGSTGADIMKGGDGNDTYTIDNSGDRAVELSASGGIDQVKASVSFTLAANVENLALIGGSAISGKGNALDNAITGNVAANALRGYDGDDRLNGGAGNDQLFGGLGIDKLTGGTGADRFVLDTALSSTNHDNIADFAVVDDTIVLDRSIFTAFASDGTIAASAFSTGTAAHDADDRIVYNGGNGNIYYDADGNGAGAQVLIAHVTAGLALTNADFLIVG